MQYIITGEPSLSKLTTKEAELLALFRSADRPIKAAAMAVLESGETKNCSRTVNQNGGGQYVEGNINIKNGDRN